MPKIFISYRRMDSQERAHRIADWLVLKYGKQNVFIDIDQISGGADFAKVITNRLEKADVVLVIVGDKWVSEFSKRNIQNDFVYIEVSHALRSAKLVIPTLLDKNIKIDQSLLPTPIGDITKLNYMYVRAEKDFHSDMQRVQSAINQHFGCRRKFIHTAIVLVIILVISLFTIAVLNNINRQSIALETTATIAALSDIPSSTSTFEPTLPATNRLEPSTTPTASITPSMTFTSTPTWSTTPTNTPTESPTPTSTPTPTDTPIPDWFKRCEAYSSGERSGTPAQINGVIANDEWDEWVDLSGDAMTSCAKLSTHTDFDHTVVAIIVCDDEWQLPPVTVSSQTVHEYDPTTAGFDLLQIQIAESDAFLVAKNMVSSNLPSGISIRTSHPNTECLIVELSTNSMTTAIEITFFDFDSSDEFTKLYFSYP